MALDVKIIISMAKPVGNIGFGYPLILEINAEKEIAYTVVSNLDEVVTAGYTVDSSTYRAARLMFMQEHAPKKIAVCSTKGGGGAWVTDSDNASKEWRQLVMIDPSVGAGERKAIADAIEAQTTYPKMFYTNAVEGLTGYRRTVVVDTDISNGSEAAVAGEVAGCEVGSYTLNNMTIKGVTGRNLSPTELDAIHAKKHIAYVIAAGDTVVSEGWTTSGEYVDNIDNNDWIKQQLEYRIQKTLNNNLKVSYTDEGISKIKTAALSVMKEAHNRGIVDNYTLNFALRADTTAEDRAARKYIGGNIQYEMAGAIHTVEITCEGSF